MITVGTYETVLCKAGVTVYFGYFTGHKWINALDDTAMPAPQYVADHGKRAWVRIDQGQREPRQAQLFGK